MGRTAHLTEPTEEQLSLGRTKCQYRNMCIRGCPFGGYYSSNSGGLVAAERTGNMVIRPNSIVTELIYDEKAGKATGCGSWTPTTKQDEEFYADVVFLCASAFNSAWIMMNSTSSRFPNGFGNGSDQLGRNVMDHHLGVGASARRPSSPTCTIRAGGRTASMCRASATSATRPPSGPTICAASATRAGRRVRPGTAISAIAAQAPRASGRRARPR
jgi:choline dehydrogenase-like flavoprotein